MKSKVQVILLHFKRAKDWSERQKDMGVCRVTVAAVVVVVAVVL
jgi:hypothetical protein